MRDDILDALATFRLARLITTDSFPPAMAFRNAVWRRFPEVGSVLDPDVWEIKDGNARRSVQVLGCIPVYMDVPVTTNNIVTRSTAVGELIGCPWCISIYLAVGVVIARRVFPRAWDLAARGLAASAVAGLAASVSS